MATDAKKYTFEYNSVCNMCAEPIVNARVLGQRLDQTQGLQPRSKRGVSVSVCQCRKCGLNFSYPMPVPSSIDDHYGVPPEGYWTEPYFEFSQDYFSRQIKDAKRLLKGRVDLTALDVGAGIGKCMKSLEAAGFDTVGIEPSKPFYRQALERMNIPAGKLFNCPVEDANFEREQFDFVTFGAVLEHLYDPAGAIEKVLDWLKPGGVVQIEVPSSDHLMSSFINLYYRLRGTNYVTNLSPMHSPFHLYEFRLNSFLEHGKKAGYEVEYSYIEVCSIYHIPNILKPILRSIMARTGRGMQLTVWLRKT